MYAESSEIVKAPSIPEVVVSKLILLSTDQQQEVLDFVEFLAQKQVYAKPIWEEIREISERVPAEEWDRLPTDGSVQHDHYLYGTPKKAL
jgi:hypothetical protein